MYSALVHTWNDGSVSVVNLIDDIRIKSDLLRGKVPLWLQQRIAMLRLCDVNSEEAIGLRVAPNLMYVYLNQKEYFQLTGAEDETYQETDHR